MNQEPDYLTSADEDQVKIAQANTLIDDLGIIRSEKVAARLHGDFPVLTSEEIEYIDVAPNQITGVSASLIPFLENDDANRALMGSNMQRQAVPLIKTDAPLVGTGIEGVVAEDSGAAVVALNDGIVEQVDATRIVIRTLERKKNGAPEVDIYSLLKFRKSNHNTCINQKPLVNVGDQVRRGEVIADGPAIDNGEIALGRNVLVAFLSWSGYNFEDSILISERIVKDDVFTSVVCLMLSFKEHCQLKPVE